MKAIVMATYPAEPLNYEGPLALVRLCGVPLLVRCLYALKEAGIKEVILVSGPYSELLSELVGRDELGLKVGLEESLEKALELLDDEEVILLPVGTVASRSFFDLILAGEEPVAAVKSGRVLGVVKTRADLILSAVHKGLSEPEEIAEFMLKEGMAKSVDVDRVMLPEPGLKRTLKPMCVVVKDKPSWLEAKRCLIFRTQKGLHFTSYINKAIEDRVVYRISEARRITPNMITILGNLMAFAIVPLFIIGHFLYASILAYLVGIIDGLDGKLARSRGFLTKLGHIEHSFDMFFEQTWYLSFTVGLYLAFDLWWIPVLGGAFLILDGFVRHVYMQFKDTMGVALSIYSKFDRAFARIDGRRNVYILYMVLFSAMHLLGFSLGPFPIPIYALMATTAHAFITALVYTVRAIKHMRDADRDSGVLAWMELVKKSPSLKKCRNFR